MANKDLFTLVMEAEGDLLQPFDASEPEPVGDEAMPPQEPSQPTTGDDTGGFDEPPPLADDNEMSFSDNAGGEENVGGDDENTNDEETNNKEDEKLSEKANNILNQQLYQKMLNRNSEIEEIINNIQILPLPYEIVKSNDEAVNKLKSALNKGQNYVINTFVDSKYGENLLFFQKLDSLYVLLMNEIDENLKKLNK